MNDQQLKYYENAKEIAEKRGGKLLSEFYENSRSSMIWKCKYDIHSEWETTFNQIKHKKSWCPECNLGINEACIKHIVKCLFPDKVVRSTREILNGKEIDIYCDFGDKKLAIEVQGQQHFDIIKNRHKNRAKLSISKSIQDIEERKNLVYGLMDIHMTDKWKKLMCEKMGIDLIQVSHKLVGNRLKQNGIKKYKKYLYKQLKKLGYKKYMKYNSKKDFMKKCPIDIDELHKIYGNKKKDIDIINDYLKDFDIICTSTEYIKCDKSLTFECLTCKKGFARSWDNIKQRPYCIECRKIEKHKNKIDKIRKSLSGFGKEIMDKYNCECLEKDITNKQKSIEFICHNNLIHPKFKVSVDTINKNKADTNYHICKCCRYLTVLQEGRSKRIRENKEFKVTRDIKESNEDNKYRCHYKYIKGSPEYLYGKKQCTHEAKYGKYGKYCISHSSKRKCDVEDCNLKVYNNITYTDKKDEKKKFQGCYKHFTEKFIFYRHIIEKSGKKSYKWTNICNTDNCEEPGMNGGLCTICYKKKQNNTLKGTIEKQKDTKLCIHEYHKDSHEHKEGKKRCENIGKRKGQLCTTHYNKCEVIKCNETSYIGRGKDMSDPEFRTKYLCYVHFSKQRKYNKKDNKWEILCLKKGCIKSAKPSTGYYCSKTCQNG